MNRTLAVTLIALLSTAGAVRAESPQAAAERIDRIIEDGLREAGVLIAPATSDEDFLRRASLDIAGQLPTPEQVLAFVEDDDPNKRSEAIERLLASDGYARNWARYWRDVIFSRATNQRAQLSRPRFEQWMTQQLRENATWDEITTDLLTATGDVREEGSVALMYAHDGDASEIAAETSRIFLGIQLSCANCHDHPYDPWKREQFHQLAAYFPRVRVRAVREDNQIRSFEVVSFDRAPQRNNNGQQRDLARLAPFLVRQFDKNRDGKLSVAEMKGTRIERLAERGLQRIDSDGDEMLSLKELQAVQPNPMQQQRTQTEHRMPNLENPSQPGERIDPMFFVSTEAAAREMSDADRRLVLAQQITEPENPWFARAYVNRVWAELVGEGFYTPIDDMGPSREARFPEALAVLTDGFTESGHDMQWLFRAITATDTYQRRIRTPQAGQPVPFASALPSRLRADQVYDSLVQVLGIQELGGRVGGDRMMAYRGNFGPRGQFTQLFGFDPSTPKEDVLGDVPQALFLMNSDFVNNAIRTNAPTRLGTLLYRYQDNAKAVEQLYLIALARKPTDRELKVCLEHVGSHDHRGEAYEDLMWSLLNSTEFVSRR